MNFSSLDLAPELQQGIDACGFKEMTPIQQQAITPARRGKDVLANAQTGTGKTAAFAIPVLQKLIDRPRTTESKRPRAMILTPTRELAEQLAENIQQYAQFLPLTVVALYGGGKMSGQAAKLKRGTDIIVSTPGRLLEHIGLCNVDLSEVEFVVLDEADRMLDMGFVADAQKLMNLTPESRQTLLFSATSSHAVNQLAKKILKNHTVVSVAKQNVTADTIEHFMYPVEERKKVDLFLDLLTQYNWFQVLVFTSTKDQADRLLGSLQAKRINVAVCHGDIKQGARRRALADFKSAKVQVLIATEVAARGIDIQGLDCVVNFNLPYLPEDYVHRIGRTGRAGNKGRAISFVSREEEQTIEKIQRLIGAKIKRVTRPGYEVSNRSSLLKSVAAKSRPARANKATETKIDKTARSSKGRLSGASRKKNS